MTEIAILTDDPGWHGARLRESFAHRGADVRFVSLRDCRFELPQISPDPAGARNQIRRERVATWLSREGASASTWAL